MAVVVGDVVIDLGVVIDKGELGVDILTGSAGLDQVLLGQLTVGGAVAVGIGEGLVGHGEARVQNGDDRAAAVDVVLAVGGVNAGEGSVGDGHPGFRLLLQLRLSIVVGDVDRLHAVKLSDLLQVAVSDIGGEAVEQGGEVLDQLVVDAGHGLADIGMLILQLGAGVGSLVGAALGYVSLRGAFQHHDGTDDCIVSVLVGVFGLELLALKALCFLQDSLRALGACDFRDLGLVCCESAAYAGQNHDQSQQHRENALEVFHWFIFLSNIFAFGSGCRMVFAGRCHAPLLWVFLPAGKSSPRSGSRWLHLISILANLCINVYQNLAVFLLKIHFFKAADLSEYTKRLKKHTKPPCCNPAARRLFHSIF